MNYASFRKAIVRLDIAFTIDPPHVHAGYLPLTGSFALDSRFLIHAPEICWGTLFVGFKGLTSRSFELNVCEARCPCKGLSGAGYRFLIQHGTAGSGGPASLTVSSCGRRQC